MILPIADTDRGVSHSFIHSLFSTFRFFSIIMVEISHLASSCSAEHQHHHSSSSSVLMMMMPPPCPPHHPPRTKNTKSVSFHDRVRVRLTRRIIGAMQEQEIIDHQTWYSKKELAQIRRRNSKLLQLLEESSSSLSSSSSSEEHHWDSLLRSACYGIPNDPRSTSTRTEQSRLRREQIKNFQIAVLCEQERQWKGNKNKNKNPPTRMILHDDDDECSSSSSSSSSTTGAASSYDDDSYFSSSASASASASVVCDHRHDPDGAVVLRIAKVSQALSSDSVESARQRGFDVARQVIEDLKRELFQIARCTTTTTTMLEEEEMDHFHHHAPPPTTTTTNISPGTSTTSSSSTSSPVALLDSTRTLLFCDERPEPSKRRLIQIFGDYC